MGIFDGVMGNASEADTKEVAEELDELLSSTEKVEHAYKLIRDLMVFTDKRLILVDKQGVTGKRSNTTPFHIRVLHISPWKQPERST